MAGVSRAGFASLILFFLWRMPTVWVGGLGAALVTLLVTSELGSSLAIACAILVMTASVVVSLAIDRRRGLNRRMLFRGRRISPRRVAALAVALVIIASVTTAIAANLMATVMKTAADDMRRYSAPNLKRGVY